MKMNIRKGDKVQVITGKDKGKQGVVLRGLPKEERVLVEGVNMVTKEAPIHVSNVMLVCPTCGKPTRIAKKRVDGKGVRVCKKCGADIVEPK